MGNFLDPSLATEARLALAIPYFVLRQAFGVAAFSLDQAQLRVAIVWAQYQHCATIAFSVG